MGRAGILATLFLLVLMFVGCNSNGGKDQSEVIIENEIIQSGKSDILLNIKDAYLFSDDTNPDRNTAEWNFMVMSEGRYEVWLTSLTRDTMDLAYQMPVIVNFGDKRLESQPVGDEIVLDKDVAQPYYRADSRLGSIYIDDPGHYNIQIISEKILPYSKIRESAVGGTHTILNQLRLKPL